MAKVKKPSKWPNGTCLKFRDFLIVTVLVTWLTRYLMCYYMINNTFRKFPTSKVDEKLISLYEMRSNIFHEIRGRGV